jgi:hypothetical protein
VASFSATADAIGMLSTFDQENLLPLSPIVAAGGPRSQATVDSLPRLFARGTPFDPGVLATVGGATGVAIGGFPFAALIPGFPELYERFKKDVLRPVMPENPVPPWPFFADSSSPGGDLNATAGFGIGFYGSSATTDASSTDSLDAPASHAASAEAGLIGIQLPGGDGAPIGGYPRVAPGQEGGVEGSERERHVVRLSGVRSSAMATGGEATIAEGLVEIADVSFLNGYIHLEGVRSFASTSPDGTSAASFVADRVTVAGRPAQFTQEGVKFFDSNQPGGQLEATVNQFLMGIGFEVHVIQVAAPKEGRSVAGLAVRFARQLLPADIPGVVAAGEDRVTLQIGFVSASALVTRVSDLGNSNDPAHGDVTEGSTGAGTVSGPVEEARAHHPLATTSASSAGIDARTASSDVVSGFGWPVSPPGALTSGPPSSVPDQEAVVLPPVGFPSPSANLRLGTQPVLSRPPVAVPGGGVDLRWSVLPECLVGLLGMLGLHRLVRRIGSVSP